MTESIISRAYQRKVRRVRQELDRLKAVQNYRTIKLQGFDPTGLKKDEARIRKTILQNRLRSTTIRVNATTQRLERLENQR